MRFPKFLALIPALFLGAGVPVLAQAQFGVSVSVSVPPPELPVYDQPPLPDEGYLWAPGYWAWDGSDYYWVPGTWVQPPEPDMLWTPGYWGADDSGAYIWNAGYWGPQVGFYGGVNYGFGYTGVGFYGGYWRNHSYFYNRAAGNFGNVRLRNVYESPVPRSNGPRVSFNGGQGGIRARPTPAERSAMTVRHIAPTPMQLQHQQRAASMPEMHRVQNGGNPAITATSRAGEFSRGAAARPEGETPRSIPPQRAQVPTYDNRVQPQYREQYQARPEVREQQPVERPQVIRQPQQAPQEEYRREDVRPQIQEEQRQQQPVERQPEVRQAPPEEHREAPSQERAASGRAAPSHPAEHEEPRHPDR